LFGLPWQRAGIGDLLVLAPIKGAENQSRRNRDGNRTAENHSRENQTAKSHFPLPPTNDGKGCAPRLHQGPQSPPAYKVDQYVTALNIE
jgi:hypothetical protein